MRSLRLKLIISSEMSQSLNLKSQYLCVFVYDLKTNPDWSDHPPSAVLVSVVDGKVGGSIDDYFGVVFSRLTNMRFNMNVQDRSSNF